MSYESKERLYFLENLCVVGYCSLSSESVVCNLPPLFLLVTRTYVSSNALNLQRLIISF